ncbi:MAG: hypothetical protein MJB57_08005 [Gemmatimonadetes bacterium]|nr:hypothetical protein [Gemmatimonadota bacterium]
MKVASPAALARLLHARLAETGDPARPLTLSDLLESVLPYPIVRGALALAGKAEYDLALLGFLRRADLVEVDPAVVAAVEGQAEAPEPNLGFAGHLADSVLRLRVPEIERELHLETDDETVAPEPPPGTGQASPSEPASASGAPIDNGSSSVEEENAPRVEPPAPPVSEASAPTASSSEPPRHPDAPDPADRSGDAPRGDVSDHAAVEPPFALEPPTPRVITEPDPWVPERAAAPRCWSCREALPDRPIVYFCTGCGISQDDRRCTGCGDRTEATWRFCARCGNNLIHP